MSVTIDGTAGVTTPAIPSAGPISATTGTFSGALQANGVATNLYPLVLGTAQASTSGTSIDFTGIPSWVKRITVIFGGVSTNGSSNFLVQIGSGSITVTGYDSQSSTGTTGVTSTTGMIATAATAAATVAKGTLILTTTGSNIWVATALVSTTGSYGNVGGGVVTLSGALDRVRITTVSGTDIFDAGTINITWEG